MKISKSFKIYIHILLAIFFAQNVNSESNLSNNIVVHKSPKLISELKFKDFNLQDVDLTGKKGNIMILNFWASWCVECRGEAHVLEAFHQKQKTSKKPLTVLGISIQDSEENARAFARQFGKTYFLALDDPSGSIAMDYGIYGVPETFFIDAEGIIRHKQIGGVTATLLNQQKEFLFSF